MAKLKLSAIPDDRPVKLTVEQPGVLYRDLSQRLPRGWAMLSSRVWRRCYVSRAACSAHDTTTPTPSRCVHASSEHSPRRLALSRRLARHEFQLRAPETLHPAAGAGEVRCLLHGRRYGGGQNTPPCAQAQPHPDLI